jgi:hypothetical protein
MITLNAELIITLNTKDAINVPKWPGRPAKPSTGEAVAQCVGKAQGLMITEMELAGEE